MNIQTLKFNRQLKQNKIKEIDNQEKPSKCEIFLGAVALYMAIFLWLLISILLQ